MGNSVKRIGIKEFRDAGYLQEVNRRFLHPLGLALEVIVDEEDGSEKLGGIWDSRDDPEGFVFGTFDGDKATSVTVEMLAKAEHRGKLPYCNKGGIQEENAT